MKITEDLIDLDKVPSDKNEGLEFVYHIHTLQDKDPHWDLRILLGDHLVELNLWNNIIEEDRSLVVIKLNDDMTWFIKEGKVSKNVGELASTIEVLDYGNVTVTESNPTFRTFEFDANKITGKWILRKEEDRWIFERSSIEDKKEDETNKEDIKVSTEDEEIDEVFKKVLERIREQADNTEDEKLSRELKKKKLELITRWVEQQE